MTREQFQQAFTDIETAAQKGNLSISGALARAAMIGIEFALYQEKSISIVDEFERLGKKVEK